MAIELHKPLVRNFEKQKVHSSLTKNIWGADLADMQLLSKFNEGIFFVVYCWYFSEYALVVLLKDK